MFMVYTESFGPIGCSEPDGPWRRPAWLGPMIAV